MTQSDVHIGPHRYNVSKYGVTFLNGVAKVMSEIA